MERRNNRRLGTLTAGITLIAVGAAMLVSLFLPSWEVLEIALKLWPCVLILLGLELLCSRFTKAEDAPRVDVGALLIMLLCAAFSFGCAVASLWMQYHVTLH